MSTLTECEERKQKISRKELVNDFEDILTYVGGWGRYQIILLVLFFYVSVLFAYMQYPAILYLYVPEHWCALDPRLAAAATPPLLAAMNSTLSEEERHLELLDIFLPKTGDGARSQCYMFDVDQLSSNFSTSDKHELVSCIRANH